MPAPKLCREGRRAAWTKRFVPSDRVQTAIASPRASTPTVGANPLPRIWRLPNRPPGGRTFEYRRSRSDEITTASPFAASATFDMPVMSPRTTRGGPKRRPAGRIAASSVCAACPDGAPIQTAIAIPAALRATRGLCPWSFGDESVVGAVQFPVGDRDATRVIPVCPFQTTSARPLAFIAMSGSPEMPRARVTAWLQRPVVPRLADSTVNDAEEYPVQTTSALPRASSAAFGTDACSPAGETNTGARQRPPRGRNAARIRCEIPSTSVQTASKSPCGSPASCAATPPASCVGAVQPRPACQSAVAPTYPLPPRLKTSQIALVLPRPSRVTTGRRATRSASAGATTTGALHEPAFCEGAPSAATGPANRKRSNSEARPVTERRVYARRVT